MCSGIVGSMLLPPLAIRLHFGGRLGRGLGDGVLDAMYNHIRHTKKLSRSKVIDRRLDMRNSCVRNSLGVSRRVEAETAGAIDFAS